MFLKPEEIESLTGKKTGVAQQRALAFMGIEHRVRPDGSIAVLRSHISRLFDNAPTRGHSAPPKEPKYENAEQREPRTA